eukprot:TRINITY_DN725_c0_g1_i1.p1 TRINITY_DN725_c0_g1~~TRINITY_DN725_c0_g1_i1.p1  ORF type:complete len:302 (+),score=54.57 TRINITY_DN725_c0_g1_i1:118-906(+)
MDSVAEDVAQNISNASDSNSSSESAAAAVSLNSAVDSASSTADASYNPLHNADVLVEFNVSGAFQCPSCGQYAELVEDHKAGDQICSNCGAIAQERLISNDAEWRVFSEDPNSFNKARAGPAYNPLMEYSLTERSRLERDEREFLWDGLRNIEEIFYRLSNGDSSNAPAQQRAKELFQQAFHMQVEQKQGKVPMKRSGDKKSKKNRQKFSRRKQFVISALYQALKECGINTWDIQDLSEQLDGIQVSKYSVRNCLKDLKLKT